jgi:hypothetical protein
MKVVGKIIAVLPEDGSLLILGRDQDVPADAPEGPGTWELVGDHVAALRQYANKPRKAVAVTGMPVKGNRDMFNLARMLVESFEEVKP